MSAVANFCDGCSSKEVKEKEYQREQIKMKDVI